MVADLILKRSINNKRYPHIQFQQPCFWSLWDLNIYLTYNLERLTRTDRI